MNVSSQGGDMSIIGIMLGLINVAIAVVLLLIMGTAGWLILSKLGTGSKS